MTLSHRYNLIIPNSRNNPENHPKTGTTNTINKAIEEALLKRGRRPKWHWETKQVTAIHIGMGGGKWRRNILSH